MKLLLPLLLWPLLAWSQTETRELVGQLGSRPALLVLHASRTDDGAWQLAGEYIVVSTLQRRFLEGEASPEIGVTTLREGTSPILFGHAPTGELRGTWRGGSFKGMRYAPGGQERERFEFSEHFPSLERYSANVHCEAGDARYSSSVNLSVEAGRLQAFDWRSKDAASGHACQLANLRQEPRQGGLRFGDGRCSVTLREVADFMWLTAENCSAACGSQGYLEPLLIDRRGSCRLLRGEAR